MPSTSDAGKAHGEEGRTRAAQYAAEIPHGCALDVAGIRPTYVHQGNAIAEMEVAERHLNQVGVVQGGVCTMFADAVAGFAAMSLVAGGKTFTTLEMRSNLVRPAQVGDRLWAESHPVHVGGSSMVLEVRIYRDRSQERKLVAFFTCTQLVMDQQ